MNALLKFCFGTKIGFAMFIIAILFFCTRDGAIGFDRWAGDLIEGAARYTGSLVARGAKGVNETAPQGLGVYMVLIGILVIIGKLK